MDGILLGVPAEKPRKMAFFNAMGDFNHRELVA
jgi:hypothetical protein